MVFGNLSVAIGAFLLSTTKFIVGPWMLIYGSFGYWETIIISMLAGWTGTLFYYYASAAIIEWGVNRKARKDEIKKKAGTYVAKKVFTKKNRNIIFIKQRFGVWGIGLITAPLISIPVGSILCAKFFRHHKSTIYVLLFYVVFYSFVVTSLYWTFMPFFAKIFGE